MNINELENKILSLPGLKRQYLETALEQRRSGSLEPFYRFNDIENRRLELEKKLPSVDIQTWETYVLLQELEGILYTVCYEN